LSAYKAVKYFILGNLPGFYYLSHNLFFNAFHLNSATTCYHEEPAQPLASGNAVFGFGPSLFPFLSGALIRCHTLSGAFCFWDA